MNKRSKRLANAASYPCPTLKPPKQRLPLEKRCKVAVVGSGRGLEQKHWRWFYKMMDRVTFGLVDPVIVSFGHSSFRVDAFAQRWASLNWLTMLLEYMEQAEKNASEARDNRVVETADYMIAFKLPKDFWVDNIIKKAKKAGVRVKVFLLCES